ncbi:restriction endonuclease subunit S [Thalassolituus oleivorans]|uniref:restriction endonuclease subunit S n=1 Tax=Thalassolituus oleivorans TaxID=187493 RepID=UPI0023F46CF7|nr:restriction endonuclease subunit S [Thalassolituus oleivorans]
MADVRHFLPGGELLPEGWVKSHYGAFLDLQNGYAFKSSTYVEHGAFVIRIGNVQDGFVSLHNPAYVDLESQENSSFKLHPDDVLVSLTGNVGRIAIIRQEQLPAVLNQRVARAVWSSGINWKYAFYSLQSKYTFDDIMKTAKGAAQLNVSTKDILNIQVDLPPLAEQKVIADKLDTLLAQVETTKARLERIPEILKTFRQSVLAAAVSGKLTEEWRKYIGQESVWSKTILLNVVESKPRNGWSPKGVDYATSIRNLTLSATTSGKFLNDKFKYIDTELSDDSYLWVKNGDILIQRANTIDYVGVSAIYTGTDNQYIYPDLMMKVTPSERILGNFLLYCLLENRTRKYFKDNATGTSGNMPKINQAVVSNTPIQLPSISEQTEIVRRVEELFAFANSIEQKTNAALERVNNLTQSILAKAFRGELTADWRAENPDLISGENSAEALLAKIKAERDKHALEKKAARSPRKTKTKA